MIDTTMQGEQIGSVISLTGSVWAVSGTSQRPLTEGAPVYEGEEIVTESDSNVEIKFADDTVLGQGEDSAVRLDDYVYTEDDNQLDFHMVKGVMRVVSGEIVKANPEGFNLSTPLATIGIRGTQVMVQVDNGREIIGVDELGEGHTVLVGNAFNQIVIDRAGMFSGVDFDGSLIVPDEMPTNFIETITRAAPLTILGDTPREPGDSQDVVPPEIYDTIDNQTGEIISEVGPGDEEEEDEEDDLEEYAEMDEEEFELSEEEIEALLELETAAGTEAGGEGEEFGQIIDVTYDPFGNQTDSNEGDPVAFGGDTGQDDEPPAADDDEDDTEAAPPPAEEPIEVEQTAAGENEPVSFNVVTEEGSTLVEATFAEGEEEHHEGELTFEDDGTITYAPAGGEDGTVIVDYTVEDSLGGESEGQVAVTLAPDSEPVVEATDSTGTEGEGVMVASGTITTDFGADTEGSSVELSADNAYWYAGGSLTAADGSWVINLTDDGYSYTQYEAPTEAETTSAGEDLSIEVTVTATDSDGDVATGTFSIALTDDGPVASDVTLTDAIEDTAISYNVFEGEAADVGIYGGTLTAASLAEDSPIDGTVGFDSLGNITFTPDADESGTATIDYTVTDSDGDTATAQMTIDVQPVNDAPEAEDKSFTFTEDTSFTITSATLLAGASDVDSETLSVVSVDGTDLPGTLEDNEDGTWTFTPGEDWYGDLTLTYTVSDGTLETEADIALTISDDMTDLVSSTTVDSVETSTSTDSEVTGVDTTVTTDTVRDAETGDFVTTTTTTTDTETTTTETTTTETTPVTTNVFEDGSEQIVVGVTTVTTDDDVTVTHDVTSESTVTVDPNAVPTATGKSFTFTEDTTFTITAAMLLEGASDADRDTVTVVSVDGSDLPGTLENTGEGVWTFSPTADWNGELGLTYTVTDGYDETDAKITLTVTDDMTDLVSSTTVDSVETSTSTDSEVTGVETTVTSDTVRDAETGDFTTTTTTTTDTETTTTTTTTTETTPVTTMVYEDGSEQVLVGETTITTDEDIKVSNDITSETTETLTLNAVPTAEDKSFTMNEDGTFTITSNMLLAGTSDADNDTVTVASVSGTELPGTLENTGEGTWTFTPEGDWNGVLDLTYTVTDGYAETDADITMTVAAVNDEPVFGGVDTGTVTEDESVTAAGMIFTTGTLTIADVDIGESKFNTEVDNTDTLGSLTITEDGEWTYTISNDLPAVQTLDTNESFTETFTVYSADGTGSVNITVTVAGTDEEPVANGDMIEGSNGHDFIIGTDGDDTIDSYEGHDIVFGLAGNDDIDADGGHDWIMGEAGDDTIAGGDGHDLLDGGADNDVIDGGKGHDLMFGNEGDDVLIDSDGNDTMHGGAGSDTFVFTSLDNDKDMILDFNTANDQIALYSETFTLATENGHVATNQFLSMTEDEFKAGDYDFENATSGLIHVDDTGSHVGALFYDPDTTKEGDEVLITNLAEDSDEPDANDITAVDIDIV